MEVRGLDSYTIRHPISHNIIMFDLLLLRPIPFSVFLTTIIRLHSKEEPDQTDNYVKHYCCINIWILCWPVLMQSKVTSRILGASVVSRSRFQV
ncbi:hypothetical protein HanHA300_Chr01g0005001 [Helianthus annuus]|nr:hypothetical protein HanHA300_Chr01g0005001 [Helianthus annuus]KAJ0621281.1 hypothetical protein HanIR_Chr01g0006901 [Helianthus annuus]KAJ0625797.1 hypothetical protein HanHA89_Chr01g0005671 [Helianthus annuus]KAJ0782160.1 hypothetical protein HanLR1_Chr01g0004951 [Helianthus annuus]